MIVLKSNDSGFSFQVCDDDEPIGSIRIHRGSTGDRYMASSKSDGEENVAEKDFDSPQDALDWIEKHRSSASGLTGETTG